MVQESEGAAGYPPRSQENDHIEKFLAQMYLSGIGRSRRLFGISKGYFGVASNGIQKGDLVCLISEAPHLPRPKSPKCPQSCMRRIFTWIHV